MPRLASAQSRNGRLDLDSAKTILLRRSILQKKKFLKKIYEEWYAFGVSALPGGQGRVLELGSGAGFAHERVPNLIRSDVLYVPELDAVLDAAALPFADRSLRGIMMTNVLHHLPQTPGFFAEAARCVRSGGVIVMVEPWVTGWSRLVYGMLHHEPFEPQTVEWTFRTSGPLSGANGALPWILFERDRAKFERTHPQWRIDQVELCMPFRYLVSGGMSMRSLMPGWMFSPWRWLENGISRWMRTWAMFAMIVLVRQPETNRDPIA